MDKNVKGKCDECNRTADSGTRMQSDLATDGKYSAHALDSIITDYEIERPARFDADGRFLVDEVSWKAFFRKHAEFITRCQVCLDKVRCVAAGGGTVVCVWWGVRLTGAATSSRRRNTRPPLQNLRPWTQLRARRALTTSRTMMAAIWTTRLRRLWSHGRAPWAC